MSSQFDVLKKGAGLASMLVYGFLLLGGIGYAFSPSESRTGVLIALALICLMPIAHIAYWSGLVGDDPTPLDPDKPTKKQKQARIMVAHCAIWAVLITFPLRHAPKLSGLLIFLIVTLVFVGLAYKTPKVNESDTKDSLKALEGWVKPIIAVVVVLIFLFGAAYELHLESHTDKALEISGHSEMAKAVKNGDILEMIALKYREVTSQQGDRNWEAEERRIRNASFNLIPRGNQPSQCDPLASTQNVTLHQGPPPPAALAVLPGYSASVNNWRRPVDFNLGHTDGIALSPDSYVNINIPNKAVYVMLLASRSGAGTDIVLENGTCTQTGNQYIATGTWHQGQVCGTYTMGIQETGATARLNAVVGGDLIEVCQVTIIKH